MKIYVFVLLCFSLTAFAQTNFNPRQAAVFDARIENTAFYVANQIGFSPSGNLFFIIDNNQKITIWETKSQKLKYTLTGKFGEAKFSPDEKRLAIVSKKEVTILSTETGETFTKRDKNEIKFLGWNPNSENFAVGRKNSTLEFLNGATGTLENSIVVTDKTKDFVDKIFGDSDYPQLVFTLDGKKFLTIYDETAAQFRDLKTGKVIYAFTLQPSYNFSNLLRPVFPRIWNIAVSPDGKWILTDNRLWNAATGNLVMEFGVVYFSRAAFSPDSHFLGMVTDSSTKRNAVALFDLFKQEIKPISPKYYGEIATWSSNGKIFVTDQTNTEASNKRAYVWEAETGNQLVELKTYAKYCFDLVSTCISDSDKFSLSPNGKILMLHNDKEVKFLNPQNGEIIFRLDNAKFPAIWSPNGNFLLSKAKEKDKVILFDFNYYLESNSPLFHQPKIKVFRQQD